MNIPAQVTCMIALLRVCRRGSKAGYLMKQAALQQCNNAGFVSLRSFPFLLCPSLFFHCVSLGQTRGISFPDLTQLEVVQGLLVQQLILLDKGKGGLSSLHVNHACACGVCKWRAA